MSQQLPVTENKQAPPTDHFIHAEDAGYHKGLKSRQIQMIAIGGAIGTGLFLGAGGRLASAGPSLFIAYGLCGIFAFLILRAMGELVLHRPSSGSFVSYAREFFGEKAAFVAGWFYWILWVTATVAETTAVALYMNFFGKYIDWIAAVPQWAWASIALGVVLSLNLISVKVFGELEFWFSLIKVGALVVFLVIGSCFVLFGSPAGGQTGFSVIADNGGIFPNGILPMFLLMQGVIFAYGAIELVGIAAGETENPAKVIPKAINAVIVRIGLFYVGSVVLLSLLLPFTAYKTGESPFVTFFSSIGVDGVGAIMNFVVITAALSSLNSGLYSTGRILRSMAAAGSAPKFALRMNRSGVPYGGVVITAAVAFIGVPLNYIVPAEAFEMVLSFAAVGIVTTWSTIVLCQIQLQRSAKRGLLVRPSYRMPGAPYTSYLTLLFLAWVLVMIMVHSPSTLAVTGVAILLVVGGWFLCRDRIREIAKTSGLKE